MSYHHLSTEERACIGLYRKEGIGVNKIAQLLGRDKSTISRELERNGKRNEPYCPTRAQKQYEERRRASVCPSKLREGTELNRKVSELLCIYWSPEQISMTLDKENGVSTSTIYRAVKSKRIALQYAKCLRRFTFQRGWRKGHKRGSPYKDAKGIGERPKDVESREEFGHWELDTVVLRKGEPYRLATMVERKSRYLVSMLLKDGKAGTMRDAIICAMARYPPEVRKTLTVDRGPEFLGWREVEEYLAGTQVYVADANRPYQRGTNENTNGLIRQFYPKKKYRGTPVLQEITSMQALLNGRPRKCLNWRSPVSVFLVALLHLT